MRKLLARQESDSSAWLLQAICSLDVWHHSSTILLFSPLPGEPDPTILGTLSPNMTLLFPKTDGNELKLYRQTANSRWTKGPFGLNEPDPENWIEATVGEVDLALIPGLAFDATGGRLGRGGGFYDRLLGLELFRAYKIGVAWHWQLVPEIPRCKHDIPMDLVITDAGMLSARNGRELDKREKKG